jgi:hypothetical protein
MFPLVMEGTVVILNEVKNPENTRLEIAATFWILHFAQDEKLFSPRQRLSSALCRMRRIEHLQLISTLNSCPVDRSRRQFNYGMDPPAHAANSPRAKLRPHRAYEQLAVECDHINRKPHPEGVHTRRWPDPEARIWIEPPSSQQPDQPSETCVGDCDPGSDHSRSRRIADCYLRPLDDSPLSQLAFAGLFGGSYADFLTRRWIRTARTITNRNAETT